MRAMRWTRIGHEAYMQEMTCYARQSCPPAESREDTGDPETRSVVFTFQIWESSKYTSYAFRDLMEQQWFYPEHELFW